MGKSWENHGKIWENHGTIIGKYGTYMENMGHMGNNGEIHNMSMWENMGTSTMNGGLWMILRAKNVHF